MGEKRVCGDADCLRPVLWQVPVSLKVLIQQRLVKVLLRCQQLEFLSRLREARWHGRKRCPLLSAVERVLSQDLGGPVSDVISSTNSLQWPWIGHFALWGQFLTYKMHALGQITSKFPCSSGIQFGDVRRQEFCELEIYRYMLLFVITMSVNSTCWIMIRAQNAVFTHSHHSCRSRFWLISATGAHGCLGRNWIWKGLLKGLAGSQGE